MPGLQLDAFTSDLHLIHAGKFCMAQIVGHESCSLGIICLYTVPIEAHDFMPDLKVGRFMPIAIYSYDSSVSTTNNKIAR